MNSPIQRSGEKISAAVCREAGEALRVEEVFLAAPQSEEITVRVAACAVCHSDIAFVEGAWTSSLPAVWGHEAAGIVERVGEGVEGLEPGDHVIATLIRSCGGCFYCKRGSPVACEAEFRLDSCSPLADGKGEPIGHGLGTAAFAEKITVHVSQVVAIPRDLRLDVASLLACGVLTGWGAVARTARMPPERSAVVVGVGGVGVNALQAASIAGATPLIAIDPSAEKRALALRFGADAAAGIEGEAARTLVLERTGGRGADYVFVTVGAPGALEQGLEMLGATGTLVIVGMPPDGVGTTIDPSRLASLGQRILGSKMGSAVLARDIPELIELYRAGRLKLEEMISGRYPLSRVNEAIASVKRGDVIRNVIVFETEGASSA